MNDKKLDQEFETRCAYTIMYANELATNLAWELIGKIKKAGLRKNGIGTRTNNLKLELNRYKFKLNDTVKHVMGFYSDYSDIRDEEMKHHVDVLYYSIHGIVINHNVEYPDILSFAELARLIADFAVFTCQTVGKELTKRTNYVMIPWMNIMGIFKALEQLSRTLCLTYAHENVNVNTKQVEDAANIFFNKLIGNGVVNAVWEATMLNKEDI